MAEECCFVCKDSGHDLRVCDSRNCLKAYHPGCVGDKDEDGFICELPVPADDHKSDENTSTDNGANDQTIPFDSKGKQIKANTSQKNKSNKRTYAGWASEELIGFLSSFGKDTSKPLDEHEIIGLVKGYIKEKKLYQDDKKLCFLCDDMLQPLFTRRKVRCKSIRRFLKDHLASNVVSEDEIFCSYEDDDDAPVIKKRPRNSLKPKIAKRVSERSKRHFASLTQNNINLIYLRRTLVVNLLSQPDTLEQKVVGCFVRVKCGKQVHSYQKTKKAYLLGQITGINKSKIEYKINDTSTDTLLCVTGFFDDVSISMLSDEDLAEDECDDLISLAEEGLLKRATVAELEEKVATIHTDIVNHWIERELLRLERKIDNAQLKGSHTEMVKLLKQKNLLNTPSERQRRLKEVPKVVPDTEYKEKETEVHVAASNSSQENRGAAHQVVDSLNVLNGESSKVATEQIHDCLNLLNKELSEVASKQCNWSRKRGAQSSSETNEPKKPRLSEERALPPAGLSFAEPQPLNKGPRERALRHRRRSTVSLVAAIGPSSPPRQGPVLQELVRTVGVNVGDGLPPEAWAEPAEEMSSPRADETVVPATELVAGPACLALVATQSGPLSACPSSRVLVRVVDPTDPELVRLDLNDEAEHAALQSAAEERRRREELSAELGRLDSELDTAAQAAQTAETARQAAVEESARLVAQLEELRRGKAASDAAAQESALTASDLGVWVQMLKRDKADGEAARQISERKLIGCNELISRLEFRVADLERHFSRSMEVRSKLQAELEVTRQRVITFAKMTLDL